MMTATILVVDDDVSVTASLELLLKQAGFGSLAAGDPQAALEALRGGRIDLVIQDMNFSRSTTGESLSAPLRTPTQQVPHDAARHSTGIGPSPGVQRGSRDL